MNIFINYFEYVEFLFVNMLEEIEVEIEVVFVGELIGVKLGGVLV